MKSTLVLFIVLSLGSSLSSRAVPPPDLQEREFTERLTVDGTTWLVSYMEAFNPQDAKTVKRSGVVILTENPDVNLKIYGLAGPTGQAPNSRDPLSDIRFCFGTLMTMQGDQLVLLHGAKTRGTPMTYLLGELQPDHIYLYAPSRPQGKELIDTGKIDPQYKRDDILDSARRVIAAAAKEDPSKS